MPYNRISKRNRKAVKIYGVNIEACKLTTLKRIIRRANINGADISFHTAYQTYRRRGGKETLSKILRTRDK